MSIITIYEKLAFPDWGVHRPSDASHSYVLQTFLLFAPLRFVEQERPMCKCFVLITFFYLRCLSCRIALFIVNRHTA